MLDSIKQAAEILKQSRHTTVFTGAGVSVESGIPSFRGEGGLWHEYDPVILEINYFKQNPEKSWILIKEIFYDFFGKAKPNAAHKAIAKLERKKVVKSVITQNIDNLHQEAGSKEVYEYHGNSKYLICTHCGKKAHVNKTDLNVLPPSCSYCGGLLKPDFIFFGEGIPPLAAEKSIREAQLADVFLVIGTTGEVMPACSIPVYAFENGAKIIEINPQQTTFTNKISNVYIQGKAGEVMPEILNYMKL